MSDKLLAALNMPELNQVIKEMQEASGLLDIPFFAIGALARNAWYVEHNQPVRGTRDIDFGVYVPSDRNYNLLREKLIEDFAYTATMENSFCLISPHSIPVDLLPFGEIEEQGKILVEGKGMIDLKLDGLSAVFRNGLVRKDIGELSINLSSIPGVVLLKLIAFDDRPEHRLNDPGDISAILEHYPYIETDIIWEDYSFLYESEKGQLEIGITALGYELNNIIAEDEMLRQRVLRILTSAIKEETILAKAMILDPERDTIQSKVMQLRWLKNGLLGLS
jgi:predicted nucleotidyltransferase